MSFQALKARGIDNHVFRSFHFYLIMGVNTFPICFIKMKEISITLPPCPIKIKNEYTCFSHTGDGLGKGGGGGVGVCLYDELDDASCCVGGGVGVEL